MGLIAREIERAGIPTVTVAVVREAWKRAPAPRTVFVPFRLGQLFGEPGAAVQQRAVLMQALADVMLMRAPGDMLELPYRWKRSVYRDPVGPREPNRPAAV